MPRFKLLIEYAGTRYRGWQIQKNARTVAGDCADDNALVHPGQATYFGTPYRVSGKDSFDYDCSGVEDGDPALMIGPKDCGLLALALCGGQGYAPTGRAFPLNGYCGSGVWTTCGTVLLDLLVCTATNVSREPPYGCR